MFAQPRAKTNRVRLLSNFRNLNSKLKHKPYPMPKIREMLLNSEGFLYTMSLNLNMGYFHIRLFKQAINICTIILPYGKYRYKRLPMGVSNPPDIFQKKMNRTFCGFEFIRSYIDDLLIITRGYWPNHLEKLELTKQNLKNNGLKSHIKTLSL